MYLADKHIQCINTCKCVCARVRVLNIKNRNTCKNE